MSITSKHINEYISRIGDTKDAEIDLAMAGLSIAAAGHGGLSTEKYYRHIEKMVEATKARHGEIIAAGGADDAGTQLAALKYAIAEKNDYRGNTEHYDNLDNANLIRVIESRKGLPIALAILYVHVGSCAGFEVAALNFPAHVICRLDHGAERILFDPFSSCTPMEAHDLRGLLKKLLGQDAELSPEFYEPSTKREMLVRLQNNLKLRQIEGEDFDGALQTVEALRAISPKENRLRLDAGILNARIGRLNQAIEEIEHYIASEPDGVNRQEAALFLQQIRQNIM